MCSSPLRRRLSRKSFSTVGTSRSVVLVGPFAYGGPLPVLGAATHSQHFTRSDARADRLWRPWKGVVGVARGRDARRDAQRQSSCLDGDASHCPAPMPCLAPCTVCVLVTESPSCTAPNHGCSGGGAVCRRKTATRHGELGVHCAHPANMPTSPRS
jgi:hypothetical protein